MAFSVSIDIKVQIVLCWCYILGSLQISTFEKRIEKEAMWTDSTIRCFIFLLLLLLIFLLNLTIFLSWILRHIGFIILLFSHADPKYSLLSILLNVYIRDNICAQILARARLPHNPHVVTRKQPSFLCFNQRFINRIEYILSHLIHILGFVIFVDNLWLARSHPIIITFNLIDKVINVFDIKKSCDSSRIKYRALK